MHRNSVTVFVYAYFTLYSFNFIRLPVCQGWVWNPCVPQNFKDPFFVRRSCPFLIYNCQVAAYNLCPIRQQLISVACSSQLGTHQALLALLLGACLSAQCALEALLDSLSGMISFHLITLHSDTSFKEHWSFLLALQCVRVCLCELSTHSQKAVPGSRTVFNEGKGMASKSCNPIYMCRSTHTLMHTQHTYITPGLNK